MAAEAILVNGATEILKRLSILVANEISLAWRFKDELQRLKKTLDMILAVMVDAENKQMKSEAVRRWLEELKDIAYEAEDILDVYSYQVIHRCQMTRKKDKVCNFFSSSNPIVFRLKIAHAIKVVNEKFNEIAKRKEILGLQIIQLGTTFRTIDDGSTIRETYSIVDQSLRIVGRDNDKSNIINKLLHNDPHNQNENIQVIPIVGMGGLGKTTLAQLIYNDDKVNKNFELKMWVCVSDDFNVKKLFIKIIESITNCKYVDVSNLEVIACQLQQRLRGKKYLLVLDDVWNKKREEWVNFRRPLLVGGPGSKIIVTTRSDSVASIMEGKLHSYKLGILNKDESWSLFKERVFGYVGGAVETPTLTTIGKELVGKCGGLPLAIIFLGSLLRRKEEIEWNAINENQIWDQSSDEDQSRILPVLKLSYDHLPSHLKQCFSYFSLFPKDHKFLRTKVILLWMAEGFILQPSGKNYMSMEEIGNEYFNSLLYNSFFQDVEKDDLGGVDVFKMHDLVHDLAKDVADECLSLSAHENLETIPDVRRLGLHDFNEGVSKTVCQVLQDKPKLRTLLFISKTVKKIEKNCFDGLKRLRVLDFSKAPNIEKIPSSLMNNLKHLRFLDLSKTKITNLPKSVSSMYHLQTLILRGCVNLKELPKDIEKLINLRHLSLPTDFNIPKEVGRLSNLQTLEPINVGKCNHNKDSENSGSGGRRGVGGGCGIEVLERLNCLSGEIRIYHLRNVTSGTEARKANLERKKNLNVIILSWHIWIWMDGETRDCARESALGEDCEYDNDEVVLEALEPHPNLKELIIDQYLGFKFPRWIGDPSCLPNLVVLQLKRCTKCERLVGFGKLPSLKMLKLWEMDGIKSLGKEFYYNSSGGGVGAETISSVLFPSLKHFQLFDMVSLEEWVDIPTPIPTHFPYLEEIGISYCPNLKITPTCFSSLKNLLLEEINESVAVPLITTNLHSLESVTLHRISKLRDLPHRLLQDSNLRELEVIGCPDFQGFGQSEEEGGFTSLQALSLVDLPALKFLPDIRSFTSLEKLSIQDCESLKPLPEDLTCLSSSLKNLKEVEIRNVKGTKNFEWEK